MNIPNKGYTDNMKGRISYYQLNFANLGENIYENTYEIRSACFACGL